MGQKLGVLHLAIAFFFNNFIHGFMDQQLQHRSRSRVLRRRPKAAIRGRRRPKAAIGQRPRYGGRRPASGRVEPAEHELLQRRQFIQVRKGPFDLPLCVPPLLCPSDAMLLPSSAIRHAITPLRPAQVPCRLNDYSCNRNQFLSPTSVRHFWAQE